MNRTTIYTLIVIALVVIVFTIWLQGDQPPTPERQAWQDWHDEYQGQPGRAHLWLLGMTAPAGDDPARAGEHWLESARQDLAESDEPAMAILLSSPAPWKDHNLDLPDGRMLDELLECRSLEQAPCDEIVSLLGENAELLARFRDWPLTTDSMRVASPDLRVLPALEPLSRAVRLDRLEQLKYWLEGQDDQARALAENANRQFRAKLGEAPNVLYLAMAVRLLADQTDWLLGLVHEGLLALGPDDPMLAELEYVDQALENSLRGEFGLMYRLGEMIEREPELVTAEASWLQRLGFRWLYKPGMRRNQEAELLHWLSGLNQPDDLSALGRGNEPIWEARVQIQNLFAHGRWSLLPLAEPCLTYVGRIHDLSAKLALARAWLDQPDLDNEALQRMIEFNPYGHGCGIELDEQEHSLCFDGPFEDRPGFRCIAVEHNQEDPAVAAPGA